MEYSASLSTSHKYEFAFIRPHLSSSLFPPPQEENLIYNLIFITSFYFVDDDGFRMRSGILNDGISFSCPQNCSCSGSSILKCNFNDAPSSTTTTITPSMVDEELYLDDNRSVERSDLDELTKLASKHVDSNSNKISILMCQKGKCYPVEDLDSFLHSCARIVHMRKSRSKRKFH